MSGKEAERALLQSVGTASFYFTAILASPYSHSLPLHSILQQISSLGFKSSENKIMEI